MAQVVVKDHSKAFMATASNDVEKAIARVTIKVQREAQRLVNQHSSLGARKNPNIPRSKKGEPPFREFGQLLRSIQSETVKRRGEFVGRVGTNLKYGRALELGLPRTRLAPRPWLRPALTSQEKTLKIEVGRALRKAVRRRR